MKTYKIIWISSLKPQIETQKKKKKKKNPNEGSYFLNVSAQGELNH